MAQPPLRVFPSRFEISSLISLLENVFKTHWLNSVGFRVAFELKLKIPRVSAWFSSPISSTHQKRCKSLVCSVFYAQCQELRSKSAHKFCGPGGSHARQSVWLPWNINSKNFRPHGLRFTSIISLLFHRLSFRLGASEFRCSGVASFDSSNRWRNGWNEYPRVSRFAKPKLTASKFCTSTSCLNSISRDSQPE